MENTEDRSPERTIIDSKKAREELFTFAYESFDRASVFCPGIPGYRQIYAGVLLVWGCLISSSECGSVELLWFGIGKKNREDGIGVEFDVEEAAFFFFAGKVLGR